MKNVRKVAVLAGAALLLMVSAVSAFAASNADTTPTNVIPATAPFISAQPQAVPANGSVWYKFNYNANRDSVTGRTPIYLEMPRAANTGVGFEVYTPSQVGDWWQDGPVGRGTIQTVDCSTLGQGSGKCQSPNLDWLGKPAESGTYYVRVTNNNATAANFWLTVQGDDVSLQ